MLNSVSSLRDLCVCACVKIKSSFAIEVDCSLSKWYMYLLQTLAKNMEWWMNDWFEWNLLNYCRQLKTRFLNELKEQHILWNVEITMNRNFRFSIREIDFFLKNFVNKLIFIFEILIFSKFCPASRLNATPRNHQHFYLY